MNGKTMKIGEFAAKYGVSDRHARRLAAEHEADLVGHIEKRGNVGTWIDEYAEAYLRDLLRNPLEILPSEPEEVDPADLLKVIDALKDKNMDLAEKLIDAERRAAAGDVAVARLEAAEQRTLLLQDVHTESIGRLEAEHQANVAKLEEFNRALQNDVEDLKQDVERKEAEIREAKEHSEQELRDAASAIAGAEEARKAAEDKLAQIRAKREELKRAKFGRRRQIQRELDALLEE